MHRLPRTLRTPLALALLAMASACSEQADPVGVETPTAELDLPTAAAHAAGHEVEYTISWNGGATHPVTPIPRGLTVQDYYSYSNPDGASANTPDDLALSNTAQFFLYQDTGTGEVSLVVILDRARDGSGMQATLTLDGLPLDAAWSVRDDPGDDLYSVSGGVTTVRWRGAPCCTDGGALSGSFDEPFSTTFSFAPDLAGIDQFRWRSFDGAITSVAIPAAAVNTLTLTAAYPNEPPEAVASGPATVELDGAPTTDITLDGSGSSDADGDALTYSWTENGVEVATVASPTLTDVGLGSHTFTLTVSDGQASDTDEVTVEVVDPSPPVVTPSLSGTEGANGWYTSPVDVTWTVEDPESPVTTTGCGPATAGEGVSTFTCTATSAGGETSRDVTVQVDSEAPTVAFSGNEGSYALTDEVAITCSATDDGSGIATVDCPEASGTAYTFGIGSHTLEASATDLAGNENTATTTFEVVGDADAVEALILEWVGNRGIANALAAKLRAAERASQRGNARAAAGAVGAFENQVRALTGTWLTQEQADFLLALY